MQAQEGEPPGEVDAMIVLIAALLIFQLTMSTKIKSEIKLGFTTRKFNVRR